MLLPRGRLVKEPFNPSRMDWLEAIGKLTEGGFSGFLDCWDLAGKGIVLFVRGRLVAARFYTGSGQLTDAEAFAHIFAHSLAGDMRLSIYRVSPELALQLYGLLTGELLFGGQQLHLLDLPHVLNMLKNDRFSGCLRIWAAEDVALVFYREGKPLGFFHDGAAELSGAADLQESIARLPGAAIDLVAGLQDPEADLPDLLQSHDISVCWQKAVAQSQGFDIL